MDINPYAQFTQDVIHCLSVNLSTLNANAKSENLWLNSTHALNDAWNSGSDDLNDPINFQIAKLADISKAADKDKPQELSEWLYDAFSGNFKISNWSAAQIAKAMTEIGKIIPPKDGENLTNWNTARSQTVSTLQQYNGVLTAQQASETSTGDTEGKAMASVIQNVTAQQTPIKDACDAFLSVLNAYASLLSSI